MISIVIGEFRENYRKLRGNGIRDEYIRENYHNIKESTSFGMEFGKNYRMLKV
jgi:hypothetical protein